MASKLAWYWAWRGWRPSTWAFLLWTALVVPAIVSEARSDEILSQAATGFLVVVWLLGIGGIALSRAIVARRRKRSEGAPPTWPKATKALPFIAVALLLYLVVAPIVSFVLSRPSRIETAVKAEWRGEEVPRTLAPFQEPVPTAIRARGVSCEGTDATVRGSTVHVCEVRHCDLANEQAFECPDTTSIACAMLLDDTLVMVSGTSTSGPTNLQEEMLRAAPRTCPFA